MHRRSFATPLIVIVLVTIATVVTFTTASSPSESATATAPGVPGKGAPSGRAHRHAANERQGRTTVVLTHRDADGRQRTCVLRWREQAQRHGDVRVADGERSTPRERAAFARALERAVADCERPGRR